MSKRMRTQTADRFTDHADSGLELESLSGDELEALLFDEEQTSESGFFNLPTMAGLAMILVGVIYLLQEFNLWQGFDVTFFVSTLPWLAGILIILLGFGVMSWRPRRHRRKVKKGVNVKTGDPLRVETEPAPESTKATKKRMVRSRNKQIAGVCAGIAEYFNIDPTLVRIAFVVGTIATSGPPFVIAYMILAWVMPKPQPLSPEERITILRDS